MSTPDTTVAASMLSSNVALTPVYGAEGIRRLVVPSVGVTDETEKEAAALAAVAATAGISPRTVVAVVVGRV